MTPLEMIEYVEQRSKAFRHEEYEWLVVGNAAKAVNCHKAAVAIEQLAIDLQALTARTA